MKPAKKRTPDILIEINISTRFPGWEEHEDILRPLIGEAVHAAVEHSDIYPDLAERSAELSLVLGDDEFIHALNREYRKINKPTNVLSFAQTDFGADAPDFDPLPFGDIILAYQTIAREAEEQRKSFEHHFTHLVVHGTLHLLGYDHEDSDEAEEMERVEIEVLQKLGIENPYLESNFMA